MATPTPEELVEAARSMIPALVARAPGDEAAAMVSPVTIAEIQKHRFARAFTPKRWNGLELNPADGCTLEAELGRGDQSVGWLLGVYLGHAFHLALYPEQAQRDIWGANEEALIASAYAPSGKAVPYKDGYRLSGHWKFSSGCDHAHWNVLGGLIDGDPTKFRAFMVPRKDFEILDDWQVAGLKATGSKGIRAEDIFVPGYRTIEMGTAGEAKWPGQEINTNPMYSIPYEQVFLRITTSSIMGSLQALTEATIEYTRDKTSVISGQKVVSDPDAQFAVAQAVSTLVELKLIMRHDFDTLLRYASAGEKLPEIENRMIKFRSVCVPERCITAGRAVYETCGGGAVFENQPMSRIYRNMVAARQHPGGTLYRPSGRAAGQALFGVEAEKLTRF